MEIAQLGRSVASTPNQTYRKRSKDDFLQGLLNDHQLILMELFKKQSLERRHLPNEDGLASRQELEWPQMFGTLRR